MFQFDQIQIESNPNSNSIKSNFQFLFNQVQVAIESNPNRSGVQSTSLFLLLDANVPLAAAFSLATRSQRPTGHQTTKPPNHQTRWHSLPNENQLNGWPLLCLFVRGGWPHSAPIDRCPTKSVKARTQPSIGWLAFYFEPHSGTRMQIVLAFDYLAAKWECNWPSSNWSTPCLHYVHVTVWYLDSSRNGSNLMHSKYIILIVLRFNSNNIISCLH